MRVNVLIDDVIDQSLKCTLFKSVPNWKSTIAIFEFYLSLRFELCICNFLCQTFWIIVGTVTGYVFPLCRYKEGLSKVRDYHRSSINALFYNKISCKWLENLCTYILKKWIWIEKKWFLFHSLDFWLFILLRTTVWM